MDTENERERKTVSVVVFNEIALIVNNKNKLRAIAWYKEHKNVSAHSTVRMF